PRRGGGGGGADRPPPHQSPTDAAVGGAGPVHDHQRQPPDVGVGDPGGEVGHGETSASRTPAVSSVWVNGASAGGFGPIRTATMCSDGITATIWLLNPSAQN